MAKKKKADLTLEELQAKKGKDTAWLGSLLRNRVGCGADCRYVRRCV